MVSKSQSVKAIELAKEVIESAYGSFAFLRFTIESLIPTNGSNGVESKKWDIICSFRESPASAEPTRFQISVDVPERSVTLKKLDATPGEPVKRYIVTEQTNESEKPLIEPKAEGDTAKKD